MEQNDLEFIGAVLKQKKKGFKTLNYLNKKNFIIFFVIVQSTHQFFYVLFLEYKYKIS